ncbi:hypothetical protein [Streptomyces sp. NPDC001492]
MALLLARTRSLGDGQVAAWDLDADPASVSRARSSVAQQLIAWGLEDIGLTTRAR